MIRKRFALLSFLILRHRHRFRINTPSPSHCNALKLADKDLDLLVRYFHFHNSPCCCPPVLAGMTDRPKTQLPKIKGRKIMHSSPLLNPWGKIKRVAFLFVSVFSGLGLSLSRARCQGRGETQEFFFAFADDVYR